MQIIYPPRAITVPRIPSQVYSYSGRSALYGLGAAPAAPRFKFTADIVRVIEENPANAPGYYKQAIRQAFAARGFDWFSDNPFREYYRKSARGKINAVRDDLVNASRKYLTQQEIDAAIKAGKADFAYDLGGDRAKRIVGLLNAASITSESDVKKALRALFEGKGVSIPGITSQASTVQGDAAAYIWGAYGRLGFSNAQAYMDSLVDQSASFKSAGKPAVKPAAKTYTPAMVKAIVKQGNGSVDTSTATAETSVWKESAAAANQAAADAKLAADEAARKEEEARRAQIRAADERTAAAEAAAKKALEESRQAKADAEAARADAARMIEEARRAAEEARAAAPTTTSPTSPTVPTDSTAVVTPTGDIVVSSGAGAAAQKVSTGAIVAGVVAVAAIAGGIWWARRRPAAP